MNAMDSDTAKTADVCRVCTTRVAERAIPFYCVKSSEVGLGPGARAYRFETPVCDACVKERAGRRVRRYWLVSVAIVFVIGITAFIAAWAYLANDPAGARQGQPFGRLLGATFLASAAGGIGLLFAAVMSIQLCSTKFVAAQLAVKAQQQALDAAGYAGYWMEPPKFLVVRR